MRKMSMTKDIPNQKYLSVEDARTYYQLCRASIMKVATEADALRRIGRRVLIDRARLDTYIDGNH